MLFGQKQLQYKQYYGSALKNKCDDNTSFKNKHSVGNFENYFLGKGRIPISSKTGASEEKANVQPFVIILSRCQSPSPGIHVIAQSC